MCVCVVFLLLNTQQSMAYFWTLSGDVLVDGDQKSQKVIEGEAHADAFPWHCWDVVRVVTKSST